MFETLSKADELRQREVVAHLPPDKLLHHRWAAGILVINVLVQCVAALVFSNIQGSIIQIVISLAMAIGLAKHNSRVENLVTGLAALGAVLGPLMLFLRTSPMIALVGSLPIWGTVGALLLLLTGEPTLERRWIAALLFGVLGLGVYGLAILLGLLGKVAAS